MARNTSVSLGDHFTAFIDEQIESGQYASASEVIRASLRLLEREQRQLAWLREKMAEAEADILAGRVHENSDEFWEALDREADARLKRGDRPGPYVIP